MDPLRRKIRLDSAFEWVGEKGGFYKVGKGRSLSFEVEEKKLFPERREFRKRQGRLPQDRMYRFFLLLPPLFLPFVSSFA